ncbi:MAG: hypothetical protein KUG78_17320 [Kangiellaceae bacterium]|nr:hypothetical protein [Kangiellaceae bacterium]
MNFQSLFKIPMQSKSVMAALAFTFLSACGGGEESSDSGDEDPIQHKLSVSIEGSGLINSSPSGIQCDTDCSKDYEEGTQITLTATASNGYIFKNWTGNCSGQETCTVMMNAAIHVQAIFEQVETEFYDLSVTINGAGTVVSSPVGVNCTVSCTELFSANSQVSLTASATEGYEFVGWSGNCSGIGLCNIVTSQNRAVTADFRLLTGEVFSINVTNSGNGVVTSNPAGISCGDDCSEAITAGTTVTLTATANLGYEFTGWGGNCSQSGNSTCSLLINESVTISAEFQEIAPNTHTLTVTNQGNGVVTSSIAGITCGTDCIETYQEGTNLTLTAVPNTGYEFSGWGGECSGSVDCSLTMTNNYSVTAEFRAIEAVSYTVSVNTNGNGIVTSNPSSIECGSNCVAEFDSSSSIVLFAIPDTGYRLSAWSGDCSGNVDCNLTVDSNKSATATFVEDNNQGGTLSISDMGLHEVNHGDIFTYQPEINGNASICRKDLGHDDVTVDSETGTIRWDTSDINFGRGFYIRIKCSNSTESAYAALVIHVDKSGSSQLRVAGENGTSQYIGVAARAMSSGDTIVFADGNYPVSVTRDESYENGFSRSSPTDGSSDQYSTIISRTPGGAVINGEAQNGIGKQKKAFELESNNYVAIVGFVVKNVQRESFTTKGTNNKLLLDFIGGQGAGTWGKSCSNFSEAGSGQCSNAGMRINGGTGMFQHSYDWGHNRYGIMTNRTSGSITRRSFVRLDEHKGDQPYGGFSNYCDTLHLSQDNTVFDSLAIAAPHYKNYAGLEAYPATGCENDSATLKTVGLLAVNNKLSLSLMDQKAGPTHIWDHIVSYDSEGTCTPQTDRCGLWLLQADKSIDVTNSFFGKARGFEGSTSIGQAFGNNVNRDSTVSINDVSGESNTGTEPEYLPQSQLYYQGRYDTFHGDDGYDSVTTSRRWPIAGEDIIAANMRSYRNPTAYRVGGGTVDINGDRGATASGESMSEYFWGYTNDKVPPLVVRVKDKGSVHRVAWENLSGSRKNSVIGWKVICSATGGNVLASLSVNDLTYADDSGCQAYGVKATYASGDSGIAYTESPQ